MDYFEVDYFSGPVSRIGIGTWAMGGSLWGETDNTESVRTLRTAFDKGINFIDTAPGYGFGLAEEVIGKAIKEHGGREKLLIATKCGLNLHSPTKVFRDSSREALNLELENSLKRLQTDYIDLYQIHWPDPTTPQQEVAATLKAMLESGKIKAIGLSNYKLAEILEFRKVAPVHALQFPFNIFEREEEVECLKYAKNEKLTSIGYSTLCRGLLTGTLKEDTPFEELRKNFDPKFRSPYFGQYLICVGRLQQWALDTHKISLPALAFRWSLDKGIAIPLWGARKPHELDPLNQLFGWNLTDKDFSEIDAILSDAVKDPIGPQYMSPPLRD